MKTNEIFCTITYPKYVAAASRMIGSRFGIDGDRGSIITCSGDPLSRAFIYRAEPDTWENGHGSVSVRQGEVIISDTDRVGEDGLPLEFTLRPSRCPVIYLKSYLAEIGECSVVFYAGKDDRMMLCAVRAVMRDDAAALRRRVRRFLRDNGYRHLGDGVYERV